MKFKITQVINNANNNFHPGAPITELITCWSECKKLSLFYYIWIAISQWFLTFLKVPNPASFVQAFTEPFVKIKKRTVTELEPEANYASVAQ